MFASIDAETLKVILQAVSVLAGVVGVCWTIIWAVRGPRLLISLLDSHGDLTRFGDSQDAPPAFFYHVRVRNKRRWTANNVRLKVTRIAKEGEESGEGEQRVPVFLIWAAHPSPKPYLIEVLGYDQEACNLGYITREEQKFKLDAMDPARFTQNFKWPPNFRGFLNAGEKMRLEVVAVAENARSNTLCLSITWDGQWSDTPKEMEKHLVVNTIPTSAFKRVLGSMGLDGLRAE